MDTSKMRILTDLSTIDLVELEERARKISLAGAEIREILATQNIRNEIANAIEDNYDFGRVVEVYEIFGGYVNRSFAAVCEREGVRTNYFVRKFNLVTTEIDVKLEHSLINYVRYHGFPEVAWAYPTKTGQTFVMANERLEGESRPRIYAAYVYLEGEDKHSWAKSNATPNELKSIGAMHARYHNAGRGFKEGDLVKAEPRTDKFYKTWAKSFQEMAARPLFEYPFHDYFNDALPGILGLLKKHAIPDEVWAELPLTTVHGDFHAGNLKFVGEDAVGMFDLDWAKVNYRLFDVCLTTLYITQSWAADNDGQIRIDDMANYLGSYNKTLGQLGGLPPLTATEKKWFVPMFHVCNLFLINWCTDGWFYQDPNTHNDYEGVRYMFHFLGSFPWIERQRAELEALVASV
ncbi:MAG: phosphotransferase [Deltaproteobacteria bacterium]|jgi:homoserine kinase type II|nr:phosphotransferase [Deltaproteobacteria bacterium]